MQFFKYTDNGVVLARPEIELYPTIAEIIKRDKGGKVTGDPDGRKKAYAFKEFHYVYLTCDFNAYPTQHSLSKLEAHAYGVKHARLPEQYEPDPVVRDLMGQYINENWTPEKKTIKNLLDTFSFNDGLYSTSGSSPRKSNLIILFMASHTLLNVYNLPLYSHILT